VSADNVNEEKRIVKPLVSLDTFMSNYAVWFVLAFISACLIPRDIDSFLIKIPEYNALSFVEGRVTYSRTTGRYGREFIVVDDKGKDRVLICNLRFTGSGYCPPFNMKKEKDFYQDKRVKIKYDANTGAILELVANSEKLLNYETQKNEYESQVGSYFPYGIVLIVVFLLLGINGYQASKSNKKTVKGLIK
jgi:hypothetical protein